MNILQVNKIIDRLNEMIDHAMNGQPLENDFDETKMSALETKLAHYLAMTQTSRTQLEEEKSKINELISDISHQTKTPIANILLYAQLLEESDLSEQDNDCVHALAAQAQKLSFLIASLLKMSRLENGIIALSPKRQPLQPMLEDIVAQCLPTAAQKGIALYCETTDAMAHYDAKWTTEAVTNIVDNAIKYTPAHGRIAIHVIAYQFFCRIDVTDTGMGIAAEEWPKIFTRFYRSPRVGDEEGVGIGLYLAREIISSEGGYIKVSSKLGNGATFSVFLPIEG